MWRGNFKLRMTKNYPFFSESTKIGCNWIGKQSEEMAMKGWICTNESAKEMLPSAFSRAVIIASPSSSQSSFPPRQHSRKSSTLSPPPRLIFRAISFSFKNFQAMGVLNPIFLIMLKID